MESESRIFENIRVRIIRSVFNDIFDNNICFTLSMKFCLTYCVPCYTAGTQCNANQLITSHGTVLTVYFKNMVILMNSFTNRNLCKIPEFAIN